MKKIIPFVLLIVVMVLGAKYTSQLYQSSKTSQNQPVALPEQKIEEGQPTTVPQAEAQALKVKKTTLAVAGDAMFDRNVWHNYKDKGLTHLFDNFDSSIFKNADLAMLNLEGPISKNAIDDDCCSGSMIFNFPPQSIDALKYLGIKAVSLANNHSYNAGKNNFIYTQNVLKENGIANFGRQIGFNSEEDIYRFSGDIPISVIGLDVLSEYIDTEIISAIKTEKASGRFVIMIPHWGVEYSAKHNQSQENLATKWVSAGADMIIGSHPHVIQDFQLIDNHVPVFYSLGNFVFDQYFSEETQQSIIVTVEINESDISIKVMPLVQSKSAPSVAKGTKKAAILDILNVSSDTPGLEKTAEDTFLIKRK